MSSGSTFRRVAVLLALVVSLCGALAASASADSSEGRYIVVLKDSVSHPGAVANDQAEEVEGDVSLVYRSALKGYAATLPRDEVDALEADPRVDYVTADRKTEDAPMAQTTPTGVERIFATNNSTLDIDGSDDMRVDADVAIIDTGVDYTHPDLNVATRTNCVPTSESEKDKNVSSCVDNSGTDDYGHGTHVAGIVGAMDNNFGVVGVAPGARIWPVRVISKTGFTYESWVVAGVDWVTAHSSQIEVANMSLRCVCGSPLEEAISSSMKAGVVYVAAAGNSTENVSTTVPARMADVISVSALVDYDGEPGSHASPSCGYTYGSFGGDDRLATFSNYGAGIDVAAPGVCILSTMPGNKYAVESGTSMASPYVAGAAAILASQSNPNSQAGVEAIRDTIVETGNLDWREDVPSPDGVQEPLLDVSDEEVFDAAVPPAVATEAAGSVSGHSAVLKASVNPNGFVTSYQFEYGATTSYGTKIPVAAESVGSGISPVAVAKSIEGLEPATTYHYRITASSEIGASVGGDVSFTTLPFPTVKTWGATWVARNSAVLSGSVNPNGLATKAYVEYGLTTSYGKTAGYEYLGSSGQKTASPVESQVLGLHAGTTYHYRIVASNSSGISYGEDAVLSTETGPFWSVNGEEASETPVAIQAGGQLDLYSQVFSGRISCGVSGAGSIWNDAGAARGSLESLEMTNCQTISMWGICANPKVTAIEQPWHLDPFEGEPWDLEIQGVSFTLVCPEGGLLFKAAGGALRPAVLEAEGGSSLSFGAGTGLLQGGSTGMWYLKGDLPISGLEGEAITLE